MASLPELHSKLRKLLACYVPLGDPLMPPDIVDVYISCGVDVLEVGLPASDPVLDGEVVRDSMERALKNGTSVGVWQRRLVELREKLPDAYLVAMGYRDMTALVTPGGGRPLADAVLQVGCAAPAAATRPQRVAFVSSQLEPAEVLAAKSEDTAYVMLQANAGRTGLRQCLPRENRTRIARLKEAGVGVPILLGIGISNAHQVSEALTYGADGVVIGSACIDAALKGRSVLTRFLTDLRAALDA